MFHPCWSFIKFFPQPLQESLSFSAIDIQYADSLLCIQSPIEWSNNEMIFITMTSQDAGRCTEKGVARLLHSPFKIAFTKGKKSASTKFLTRKDQLDWLSKGENRVCYWYITPLVSKVLCWPNKSYSYDLYLLCP